MSAEQVTVSHIQVLDEATAQSLKAQLDAGADFADLAREHSMSPNGVNGGELGIVRADGFHASRVFVETALSLEIGQVSDPVLTSFAWELIKRTA
jgi:parvulin-like peptidyl-prolyl isomerase